MSEKKNILTQPKGYNVSRMIFSNPVIGTIGDVTYRRIWISTKHPDGSTGSLLLPTEQLYSFGISENRNPATKQITGYSMALAMWSKENPTQEQKDLTNTLTKINEHCVKHLISIRKELKQPKLVKEALPKFGGLYWKEDEDGNIIKGVGPTLYPKIVLEYDGRKKKKAEDEPQELKDATLDRVRTMFYDYETGQSIDPKTLLGRACAVEAVIKIESIFVGAKIALQIKLYEARVKLFDSGMKRLLTQRPPAESQVEESEEVNPIAKKDDDDEEEEDEAGGDEEEANEDDDEEEAEIPISDNEEEEAEPPPKLKVKAESKPTKKVPPRKTKK